MFLIWLVVGVPIAWSLFGPVGASIYVVAVILMFMASGKAESMEQDRPSPEPPPEDPYAHYDTPDSDSINDDDRD